MPVDGVQSAMFFYAFKDRVPHVLKVPTRQRAAATECRLWQDIASSATHDGAFCMPLSLLELGGEHEVLLAGGSTDVTQLRSAILMPRYACTLSNIPPPLDAAWALQVLARMVPSLRVLHVCGWLHGDVKH
jgi:hypothetical protein